MTAKHSKSDLRKQLRQWRRQLSDTEQLRAQQDLTQQVSALPCWQTAQRIALYQAFDGEIGTDGIAQAAQQLEKQLYLPVVGEQNSLSFAHWFQEERLQEGEKTGQGLAANKLGILEPPEGAPRLEPEELDIVFLPLVGWDQSGNRLGMGGGYYDRAFAADRISKLDKRPVLIGLSHHGQEVESLPTDAWDVALDWIVTDKTVLQCSNRL